MMTTHSAAPDRMTVRKRAARSRSGEDSGQNSRSAGGCVEVNEAGSRSRRNAMDTMVAPRWIVAALAVVVLGPVTAAAQSAIAGVVKDASGAVIPGVTVEAASPELI